ncbi:hypothetical protein BsWGS_27528 [Bradybaena similaris]
MDDVETRRAQADASQATLGACLTLLQQASSDNDTFSALLTITRHVRSKTFTIEDQRTVLEAAGLEFVSRLLNSQSVPPGGPPGYYKCVGLSILSAWTMDPIIAMHPAITDFLPIVNKVISPDSLFKACSHPDSHAIYGQMCRDSEEILFNLTMHEIAVDLLLKANTLELLLEHSLSPSCQNVVLVLESLSSVITRRGEGCLNFDPGRLLDVMQLVAKRLDQESDIKEKTQCARILTSFLAGLSMVEVTVQMDWVRSLVLILRKLISAKLAPDDSQAVLGLVCALVSTAGPQVLGSEVSGDDNFLKAVVARVSVEIYMQLDGICVKNACERFPILDRVYKLLSSVVQFMAETGEGIDSSSIIVIYRKLVDISETIMEFLFSVAYKEIQFPKTHIVVLISVRTLAAMLAEITEEVTPRLLELLPFFNLLCQNIECSNDVVLAVTNTAQTPQASTPVEVDALIASYNTVENRLSPEFSSEHHKMDISSCEFHGATSSVSENSNHTDESGDAVDAFCHLNIADPAVVDTVSSSLKMPSSSSLPAANGVHSKGQQCENDRTKTNNVLCAERDKMSQGSYISLSQESIENFKAFQAMVYSSKAKSQSGSSRKVFRVETEDVVLNDQTALEQWRPMPGDVLGFLLPAYMCLLDNQEVVEVMSRCGAFQTIVTFVQTSLLHLLDSKSSGYPESSTVNALSVIELVYTTSPITAASLDCFQELFETSLLSLPSLLTLPQPPPLVCLKLLEVTLTAYRLQTRDGNKRSSLPHPHSQLFRAAVDYLSSFYEIREHRGKQPSLHIKKEFRVVWPLAEESWSGCIAGLCTLVRSVEELQESLNTSAMFPEFLSFLASYNVSPVSSETVQGLVKSMFSLLQSAAEGSAVLCELILRSHGQTVARKFHLKKLDKCLQGLLKK